MSANYDFSTIEPRWQQHWDQHDVYRAVNPPRPGSEKPHFYVLDFFPYPSGAGLHVGHPLGYIASDIISRFMRLRGYNVLHPMGWDAFGLPAEQYAIDTGVHPAITTRKNIETYRRQLRMIGLGYDWDREIATCMPDYYKWTQWIFLQIYNSWYDPEHRWTDASGREVTGAARPIDDLPIPKHVREQGEEAVRDYRDEHRLAYVAEVPVNWCPALGTVLANEEVTSEGRSERGNHPVFRRPMKQWMLRITEYADRLLEDLAPLDWPEPIKIMQREWIGRSEGAYVDFELAAEAPEERYQIRVFTTRPDTLFGATYLVLAPEHRLTSIITAPEQRAAVNAYVRQAKQKSERDRTAEARAKTGVFTGAYAVNPVNQQRVPIWVADYVLATYGTGSIMAVPGSDKRDLEFAEAFDLPVVQVVEPPGDEPWRGYEGHGTAVNSPPPDHRESWMCDINGLPTPEAKQRISQWLEERDLGERTVQYKLRDWLFARQRYWGEPFPIVYDESGRPHAVDAANLPVELPEMEDFRPEASDDPQADVVTPLARATDWLEVKIDGERYTREMNTMPQWAGSCWYYLRFLDPHNEHCFADREVERYWMGGRTRAGEPKFGGVDLYMGGAEHAVLHLLYARFWHKILYDLRHVSTPEPFQKLFNQGMIGAPSYVDERGVYVPLQEVTEGSETEIALTWLVDQSKLDQARASGQDTDELRRQLAPKVQTSWYYNGEPVYQQFEKMSKTKKNVVNPDEVIAEYGADTLRLYEMYMGPLEASKPWNTRDIIGVHRFLQRVWRLVVSAEDPADPGKGWRLSPQITDHGDDQLERLLHKTIQKVEHDLERFAMNTAIAQMIVWSNAAQKAQSIGRSQIERFLTILSPFAPHIADELWERLGNSGSLVTAEWPAFDEALTKEESVEIAVQIKGKVRGRTTVPADADDEQLVAAAKEAVAEQIAGKEIRRAIVVKGRLVNLIV